MKNRLLSLGAAVASSLAVFAAPWSVPGTYRNPVVNADFPDPTMCRAGDYVYMITTTMHFVPGAPVMRTRDMVHWEIVSYVFDRFDFKPEYSLEDPDGRTAYGGGQWATSLVHHDGRFYAWFIANGAGGFVYTADRAEGPWRLLTRAPHLHDGSLLFDDDGRVYVFHGSGRVTELEPDFSRVKPGGLDRQLFERGEEKALLEGSAAFKKDGWYYLMMVSAYLPGHPRREVCYRSRSLTGEWEKKVILETEFEEYGGVGQGCVVECPDGKWRAMVFQDRGGIGRVPSLMDVTWRDGWPILGDKDGKIPNDPSKPYPDVSGYAGSDEFDGPDMDLKWQWNHNPLDGAWSLAERPGWLRLKAAKAAPDIYFARNTLTQRMVAPSCEGVVKLDVSRMKDGDRAGLAAFQSDSAVLSVVMENGAKRLVMSEDKTVFGGGRKIERVTVEERESVPLESDEVYMRVRADFRPRQDWAELDWSLDGKSWRRIGPRVAMKFDWQRFFTGSRFALFCYSPQPRGGSVDFDFFRFSCDGHEAAEPRYDLRYDKPAAVWEEALPLGSGAVGAMVWGGVASETVDLNEDTIWSGSPNSNVNPAFRARFEEMRDAVVAGELDKARPDAFPGALNHGMNYQYPGSLKLDFDGIADGAPQSYSRTLSLDDAFARVSFASGGVRHDRAAFTPLRKGGFVYSLKTDKEGALGFKASLKRSHGNAEIKVEGDILALRGVTSDKDGVPGKVRYTVLVKIDPGRGGRTVPEGEALRVSGATRATVYVAIGTNFKSYDDISGDADAVARARLSELVSAGAKRLFAGHRRAYRAEADRCTLFLGPDRFAGKTTDRRLAGFASSDDPYFAALYFRFGRYLLISCSQPGTQPANLQGLWNNSLNPPWCSKYTVNINTEMNYWPSEPTNLPELSDPLFKMIGELAGTGAKAAREMYGAKGWTVHHNTDIWRIAGPVDTFLDCGWWPSGGGWLATHLWEHWLYSRDRAFLERAYPVLKGAAEFFDTFGTVDKSTGTLVFAPSNSPENRPRGRPHGLNARCTMDMAIVRDIWNAVIAASKELRRDADYAAHLAQRIELLEPYHVGKWGQLQEWGEDLDSPGDHHRHVSHLYGLYPSAQITPDTPELFDAARVSLEHRGDISTGWAMGWRVCLWARLLDGDRALKLIKNQLSPPGGANGGGGTYPNLFDAHPPFQIDGNFGCTAGIAEMLMQSHRGFIELLPALPRAWPEGSVKGLRARGDWTVDFAWKDGAVTHCAVKAGVGGKLRVKINGRLFERDMKSGETFRHTVD